MSITCTSTNFASSKSLCQLKISKEYTVSIPDSVTSIDNEAFYLCDNLKLIYYNGSASGSPWGAGAEL